MLLVYLECIGCGGKSRVRVGSSQIGMAFERRSYRCLGCGGEGPEVVLLDAASPDAGRGGVQDRDEPFGTGLCKACGNVIDPVRRTERPGAVHCRICSEHMPSVALQSPRNRLVSARPAAVRKRGRQG